MVDNEDFSILGQEDNLACYVVAMELVKWLLYEF